jgi:hypothetical protein
MLGDKMHPDVLGKLPELERDWMNAWIAKLA